MVRYFHNKAVIVYGCDYIAQLNSADQNIASFLSVMKF